MDTDRRHPYQRPTLYPKQEEAIFTDSRYAVIEGSTKCGKTVACIAWILEQALSGGRGHAFWWISPVYPQAKIAFRRLKQGLDSYQEFFTSNESEMTVKLLTGAVIAFKSAEKPDNLYGEDVYGAVLDEASRMREESWYAVRSTLTATRGKVRIIGNVKGRRNWAYKLARNAETGEADWHYAKLTAYDAVDAGVIELEEVQQAQSQLPEAVFKELYLAEPADSSGNPFGQQAIDSCVGLLSSEEPVIYGIDLAKSVDWTVLIGLDSMNRVCRVKRFQLPWEATIDIIIEEVGDCQAIIDSTGVGDPVVERLQRRLPRIEGYHFSSPSKQKLMEGLSVAIQSRLITYPEGPVLTELDAFGYEYTRTGVKYSAPQGVHDDCVMALALAVHGASINPGIGVW